jgi:hypothetical protein
VIRFILLLTYAIGEKVNDSVLRDMGCIFMAEEHGWSSERGGGGNKGEGRSIGRLLLSLVTMDEEDIVDDCTTLLSSTIATAG